jgi:hypothetical protein
MKKISELNNKISTDELPGDKNPEEVKVRDLRRALALIKKLRDLAASTSRKRSNNLDENN